ncbi:MAG: FAD-dependent oxidoreductase [Clostridia bacterium]|nr:FAD-dependent oxidoreductase [Clostridia bacterium]
MYDIAVIGAGPAGLTAAIYARRADKTVIVIEKEGIGGQMAHSPRIENFPGYPIISGNELACKLSDQAEALGAVIEFDTVTAIKNETGHKTVVGEYGEYKARAVIIAAGAKHRTLGIPGEDELNISYCAVCDGAFYKDKDICIIGGGNSAMQEVVYLSDICKSITVIQNLPCFTGEKKLEDKINASSNVKVVFNTVVEGFESDNGEITAIRIHNTDTNKHSILPTDGVFVAIGHAPENQAFESVCKLNELGYIVSDECCLTETEGVFVAGDCRTKMIRQITTAAADGSIAAIAACRYLDR